MIPVLFEWEELLAEALDGTASDELAFCSGRTGVHRNFVTNFVAKTSGVGLKPQLQRLRATWIVHHLAAGTPAVPFMQAAGVQSLEALTRYLRFVPDVDLAEARRKLRGELVEREQ